jgi:predicted nuclease of predicted toxin-antitoxin system
MSKDRSIKIRYYFDEMMHREVAEQLVSSGYDVIMANDVGMIQKPDPEHLAYATADGRVIVTFDRAFAGITSKSLDHAGLVCLKGKQNEIGRMVRVLSQFADEREAEDVVGQVFWL